LSFFFIADSADGTVRALRRNLTTIACLVPEDFSPMTHPICSTIFCEQDVRGHDGGMIGR